MDKDSKNKDDLKLEIRQNTRNKNTDAKKDSASNFSVNNRKINENVKELSKAELYEKIASSNSDNTNSRQKNNTANNEQDFDTSKVLNTRGTKKSSQPSNESDMSFIDKFKTQNVVNTRKVNVRGRNRYKELENSVSLSKQDIMSILKTLESNPNISKTLFPNEYKRLDKGALENITTANIPNIDIPNFNANNIPNFNNIPTSNISNLHISPEEQKQFVDFINASFNNQNIPTQTPPSFDFESEENIPNIEMENNLEPIAKKGRKKADIDTSFDIGNLNENSIIENNNIYPIPPKDDSKAQDNIDIPKPTQTSQIKDDNNPQNNEVVIEPVKPAEITPIEEPLIANDINGSEDKETIEDKETTEAISQNNATNENNIDSLYGDSTNQIPEQEQFDIIALIDPMLNDNVKAEMLARKSKTNDISANLDETAEDLIGNKVKRGKKRWLILVALILLLAVVFYACKDYWFPKEVAEEEASGMTLTVVPSNGEDKDSPNARYDFFPGSVITFEDDIRVGSEEYRYIEQDDGTIKQEKNSAFAFRFRFYIEFIDEPGIEYTNIIDQVMEIDDARNIIRYDNISGYFYYYNIIIPGEKYIPFVSAIKLKSDLPNDYQGRQFKIIMAYTTVVPASMEDMLEGIPDAPADWQEAMVLEYDAYYNG